MPALVHCRGGGSKGGEVGSEGDGRDDLYGVARSKALEAHQDGFAFFELRYNDLSTEIWKCDVCGRMMVFDSSGARVSRYMRRIDAESLGKDVQEREVPQLVVCGHA